MRGRPSYGIWSVHIHTHHTHTHTTHSHTHTMTERMGRDKQKNTTVNNHLQIHFMLFSNSSTIPAFVTTLHAHPRYVLWSAVNVHFF